MVAIKKNLSEQIARLAAPAVNDFDPEDDVFDSAFIPSNMDSGSDEGGPVRSFIRAGIEEEVDSKYAGTVSSRKELLDHIPKGENSSASEDEEFSLSGEDSSESDHSDDDFEASAKVDNLSDEEDSDSHFQIEQRFCDDSQSAFEEELLQLEQEASQGITTISQDTSREMKKGMHVRTQLRNWETILELRIKLQKLLLCGNSFPQPEDYQLFLENDSSLLYKFNDISNEMSGLLSTLLELQYSTLGAYSGSESIVKEKSVKGAKKRLREDSADFSDYWNYMTTLNEYLVPYERSVISKWGEKVRLASGNLQKKKLKAVNQGIVDQIDQIMMDENRLISRTQIKRTDYHIMGQADLESGSHPKDVSSSSRIIYSEKHDPEIFDDTDFYHQLLRDLIDQRSKYMDGDDPITMGQSFMEIHKLRMKSKKQVDTKAS
eukprot:Sdes_comp18349_c0_seq1m8110